MRILLAPDKFKGSLGGRAVAEALARGIRARLPEAGCDVLPMADGGEGLLEAFHEACGGDWHTVEVADPLGRRVEARWLMVELGGAKTAVIETSQACGLWRLAPEERNPMETSTFGVGELMLHAAAAGAEKMLVGIGGSGTNDAGAGMARALGYRFLGPDGADLRAVPSALGACVAVRRPAALELPPVVVASDVVNPLCGPRGATRVYGPQKGLKAEMADELESIVKKVASAATAEVGADFSERPGAGAAGGLGWALMTFCGGAMERGFDLVASALGLEERIALADWVLTGEGSLDGQTAEGKTPYGVAMLARKHGKPVVAVAGRIADEEKLRGCFDAVMSLATGPITLEESCARAEELLCGAGSRVADWIQLAERRGGQTAR